MTAELVFGGVFIAVMVTGFLEKNGNYHAWNDTVRVVRSGRFSWVIPIAIIFAIVNVILTSLTLGAASSATEPASVDTSAVTEPSMLGRMILAMMIGMVIAVKMYFVKYFSVRAFGSLIGAQGGFYQPSSIQNKLDQENYGKVFLEGAIPILILTMLVFAFTNIGLLTLTAISGIAWLAYISAVIRHSQGDRPKVKEKVTEGKYAFNS
ncbi:hypothetical protein [Vibrio owensii]|uniref:hypothetical protein n=1 Tax=Vibrio harveyi group TaxID=717610 RepID=UPI003CC69D87